MSSLIVPALTCLLLISINANLIELSTDECPVPPNENQKEICEKYFDSDEGNILRNSSIVRRSVQHATPVPNFNATLNGRRIEAFFEDVVAGKPVSIFVFGGSMTAGRMVGGSSGAWPTILQAKLMKFPNVKIHNYAVSATTSEWLMHRLPLYFQNGEADLVILDYCVNDCASFRMGRSPDDESRLRVLGTFEVVVKNLFGMHSRPAVVFFDVAISHLQAYDMSKVHTSCEEYNTCYQMYNIFKSALQAYAVPTVSQKLGIWPKFACGPPKSVWECTRSCAHPKGNAHAHMAEMMFYYFEQQIGALRALHNASPHQFSHSNITRDYSWLEEDDRLLQTIRNRSYISPIAQTYYASTCSDFTTTIDHVSSEAMGRRGNNGKGGASSGLGDAEAKLVHIDRRCWHYGEDRPGKFGWLANTTRMEGSPESCFNAPLVFRVKFGAKAQGVISVLNTYDKHVGMVDFALSPPLKPEEVDAPYVYDEKAFKFEGIVDNYFTGAPGDDRTGHSIITPELITNEFDEGLDAIIKDSVQYIRFRLVDCNKPPYESFRSSVERKRGPRELPSRVKIVSFVTC